MNQNPSDRPKLGSKHRLLLRVERFSRQHYRLVFLMALLALVAGLWLGSQLKLESDMLALIPRGNRQVDTFRSALEDFGSVDYLMVLLETDDPEGPDVLEDFADLLAEHLRELNDLVEVVDYRFDPDSDFLELFYANAMLFLPPDRQALLAAKLSDADFRTDIDPLLAPGVEHDAEAASEWVTRELIGRLK